MAICEVCRAEYDAKRATSRYCGPTCRSKASRASVAFLAELALHPPSVASLSVADNEAAAGMEAMGFTPSLPECVPDIPHSLPDCVPDIIKEQYNRDGPEYRSTINKLVSTSIDDLLAACVSVPVWRYQAGQASLMQAHTAP